jgi:hypothetical protein
MRTYLIVWACTLAIAAAACDRPAGFERPRQVLGPIPLEDRIAYVDAARDVVIVVEADAEAPLIHHYAIGRGAVYARPAPDGKHLAVITRGEEAIYAGQIDEEPTLWYLDATDPDAQPVAYPIGSPFDRLAIATSPGPSGHPVAVAYFGGEVRADDGVFRNPNEIAIIDLGLAPGEDNPTPKTVRSFGATPDGVILSPPMRVAGSDAPPRTFAFVLAEGQLAVIDTEHPTRRDISIRLDGVGERVLPREIVFEPDAGLAYLRSDGARDVLEIELVSRAIRAGDAQGNDFLPVLAELGAGGGPADIEVFEDGGGRRLILAATPSTRELALIDAATGGFTTVSTPDPISRITLFPQGEGAVPRVALLSSTGPARPRVHLLSLDELADELAPVRIETIELGQPVLDVVPVPGRELGMLVHDDARTILGLLDVTVGTVAPLQGVGRLDAYAFSSGGSHLVGLTSGASRVGLVDLDTLHPTDIRLDDPPRRVFAMQSGALLIEHADPFGLVTIVPSAQSRRDEAIVLHGFLLADVLGSSF